MKKKRNFNQEEKKGSGWIRRRIDIWGDHHHRQLREEGIEEGEVARHTIVKTVSQQQLQQLQLLLLLLFVDPLFAYNKKSTSVCVMCSGGDSTVQHISGQLVHSTVQ